MFKSQNQLIAEIHNEFDSAQERLLNEAKQIIAEAGNNLSDKAERLLKVGFINSDIVVKHRQNKEVLVKNTDEANLIEYYKQTYPFQKFLTESELNRICKKYNLIYAPVANYKKDVPEKNLREIENCGKLCEDDCINDLKYCKINFDNSFFLWPVSDQWMSMFSKWRRIIEKKIDGHFRNRFDLTETLNKKYNTGIQYLTGDPVNITINRQGLFIAAPESHFNLKGLAKDGLLHSNFSITITEPKDPIVFRFCRGGIHVISKWGLEADDKDLVNEKTN